MPHMQKPIKRFIFEICHVCRSPLKGWLLKGPNLRFFIYQSHNVIVRYWYRYQSKIKKISFFTLGMQNKFKNNYNYWAYVKIDDNVNFITFIRPTSFFENFLELLLQTYFTPTFRADKWRAGKISTAGSF